MSNAVFSETTESQQDESLWFAGNTGELGTGNFNLIMARMYPLQKEGDFVTTWYYNIKETKENNSYRSTFLQLRFNCKKKSLKMLHALQYRDKEFFLSEKLDMPESDVSGGTMPVLCDMVCKNNINRDELISFISVDHIVSTAVDWMRKQEKDLAPDPTK